VAKSGGRPDGRSRKTKKAPAGALSTVMPDLFVQFRRHMHAVTGKGFGNFVRRSASGLRLSGDFRFRTVHVEAVAVTVSAAKEPKEAVRAITATKVLMLFMI
jgi:hypothetical protein